MFKQKELHGALRKKCHGSHLLTRGHEWLTHLLRCSATNLLGWRLSINRLWSRLGFHDGSAVLILIVGRLIFSGVGWLRKVFVGVERCYGIFRIVCMAIIRLDWFNFFGFLRLSALLRFFCVGRRTLLVGHSNNCFLQLVGKHLLHGSSSCSYFLTNECRVYYVLSCVDDGAHFGIVRLFFGRLSHDSHFFFRAFLINCWIEWLLFLRCF